jgi:hypothetical protein
MFRSVELRHLIEDFGVVFQRLKAMGEVLRYVQHLSVSCRQYERKMLFECRRSSTKVDNDVVNRAPGTPHNLCFRVGRGLKMHAAQGALTSVERDAALHIGVFQSVGLKLSLTIRASEKPPLICVLLQLNDKCSFKPCLGEDDGSDSPLASVPRPLVQPSGTVTFFSQAVADRYKEPSNSPALRRRWIREMRK